MAIGNAGIGSAGLSPTVSIGGAGISKNYLLIEASAEATGATEITFTLLLSQALYAGVEWGVDPDYTWSTFDAVEATSHVIVIDGADGVMADTTYAWRPYATNDPLDAPANRIYGTGGTVSTVTPVQAIGLEGSADFILMETGDLILMELGASADISAFPAASTLGGTEVIAGVQGGNSRKVSIDQIKTYVNT